MFGKKGSCCCLASLFRLIFSLAFMSLLALAACAAYLQIAKAPVEFDESAAARVSFSPLEKVVPSDKLPSNLALSKSNNNLDITKFNDRYYFAFRSAPTHFASPKTTIYLLSSSDLSSWQYETEFMMGSDLREPRFLAFKDKLFFYFFQGGGNPLSFAPQSMYVSELSAEGEWSQPKPFYEPGYVVWRVKERGGKAYMSVYYGVGLYSDEHREGSLQLLVSDDGLNYAPVDGKKVTAEASAEEGEFEFDEDGTLYATVRMEMKGGQVCSAPSDNLTAWNCKFTPFKYDSSLMFRHGKDFYVVARRNVDGKYNRESTIVPESLRSKYYLVRYSLSRKRTALYRLDKEKLELVPVLDFPSRGDTAFAGIVKIDDNKYYLLNYSSDIDGFDWSWIWGQIVGSNIYGTILEFK